MGSSLVYSAVAAAVTVFVCTMVVSFFKELMAEGIKFIGSAAFGGDISEAVDKNREHSRNPQIAALASAALGTLAGTFTFWWLAIPAALVAFIAILAYLFNRAENRRSAR